MKQSCGSFFFAVCPRALLIWAAIFFVISRLLPLCRRRPSATRAHKNTKTFPLYAPFCYRYIDRGKLNSRSCMLVGQVSLVVGLVLALFALGPSPLHNGQQPFSASLSTHLFICWILRHSWQLLVVETRLCFSNSNTVYLLYVNTFYTM